MKTAMINVYGKKYFAVDTEIAKEAYRPGITTLKVKDDKGNDVYGLGISYDRDSGMIGDNMMIVNRVSNDGTLMALLPVADDEKLEDIKALYGAKLVKAATYLATLKDQMAAEAVAVDEIFAGAAEVQTFGATETVVAE